MTKLTAGGDLTVDDYLSRCRFHYLPVARLEIALEGLDGYLTELADEDAYGRARGCY